ncbi:MAG: hypothetical protein Q8L01_00775 [Candidatus Woesebacteria bacterium]|nr:hypothetical protein [Candidatus Woesebacteria bacterium]
MQDGFIHNKDSMDETEKIKKALDDLLIAEGSPPLSSFFYSGDIAREREADGFGIGICRRGGSSAFAFEPRTFPLGRPLPRVDLYIKLHKIYKYDKIFEL